MVAKRGFSRHRRRGRQDPALGVQFAKDPGQVKTIAPREWGCTNAGDRYDYRDITSLAWHPHDNLFAFANTEGEVFIHPDFVPSEHEALLKKGLQPAPLSHDPLAEVSANVRRPTVNGDHDAPPAHRKRARTPDSLDDILPSDGEDGQSDFIIDDDGAGYAEAINGYGKRPRALSDALDGHPGKRRATQEVWRPTRHESFQPGSTPWRGDRRYLCR